MRTTSMRKYEEIPVEFHTETYADFADHTFPDEQNSINFREGERSKSSLNTVSESTYQNRQQQSRGFIQNLIPKTSSEPESIESSYMHQYLPKSPVKTQQQQQQQLQLQLQQYQQSQQLEDEKQEHLRKRSHSKKFSLTSSEINTSPHQQQQPARSQITPVQEKIIGKADYFVGFESFSSKNTPPAVPQMYAAGGVHGQSRYFQNSNNALESSVGSQTQTSTSIKSQRDRIERMQNLQKKYIGEYEDKLNMDELTIDSFDLLSCQPSTSKVKSDDIDIDSFGQQYDNVKLFQEHQEERLREKNVNSTVAAAAAATTNTAPLRQLQLQQFDQNFQKSPIRNFSAQRGSNQEQHQQQQQQQTSQVSQQQQLEKNFSAVRQLRDISNNLSPIYTEKQKRSRGGGGGVENEDWKASAEVKEAMKFKGTFQKSQEYYEEQFAGMKLEKQKLTDLLLKKEIKIQEMHDQLRAVEKQEYKQEQLQQLLHRIKHIDIHTEKVFQEKLEKEKREKEQALSKNYELQKEVQGLEKNLLYLRDLLSTQDEQLTIAQSKTIEKISGQLYMKSELVEKLEEQLAHVEQSKEQAIYVQKVHEKKMENSLLKQIDDLKKITDKYEEKISMMTSEIKFLGQSCKKSQNMNEELKKELEDYKQNAQELHQQNMQLQHLLRDISRKREEFNQKNQQNDQIDILLKQIDLLKGQNASDGQLQKQIDEESRKTIVFQKQMEELKMDLKTLEEYKIALQNENEQLKRVNDAYLKQIEDVKEQTRVQHGHQFDQVNQLKYQKEQYDTSMVQLQDQLKKHVLRINSLEEEQTEKGLEVETLKNNQVQLTKKNEEMAKQLSAQIENSFASDKQKCEEIKKLKAKLKKVEDDNFTQIEEFRTQLNSYYQNLIEKQATEISNEQEKEQYQAEIMVLKKRVSDQESMNSILNVELGRLNNDLKDKKAELDSLFTRLKDYNVKKPVTSVTAGYPSS